MIFVNTENHMEPTNTFCGQSGELMNVKPGGYVGTTGRVGLNRVDWVFLC